MTHIVNSYDQELASLTESIVEMGLLVRDMIMIVHVAVAAERSDQDFVAAARSTDLKVNSLCEEIEQQATNILALRQPVAIDLRQAVSALKLAVIMERMGDLAKNSTKRVRRVTIPINPKFVAHIHQMLKIVANMMEEVIDALQKNDDQKTRIVCRMDQQVDSLYTQLINELQSEMISAPSDIPSIMQTIFIVKNIERIGDYITKVANIIHYIVSGERVMKNHG
jgi:phosphate transport system protein